MTTTTTTTKRLTQAQREKLQELLNANWVARVAAAALRQAEKDLESAEQAALPILADGPRTIRDEDGNTRRIEIRLDKSYTASGTAAQRVQFAKTHGLKISAPDCSTSALKTRVSEAIAAGILVPVPKIIID